MSKNYNDSDFSKLVNEVSEKADIVAIIGERIPLTKKGSSYWGLCPFHDDHNASLSVKPSDHVFHCWSCHAKGGVIKFVQDFDKISFMDALRKVAATVNIKVNPSKKDLEREKNRKYYDCTEKASQFYSFYLKNAIEGKQAIVYLHNRQLDDEIISHFRIGLAGSGEDDLYKQLTSLEYLSIDLEEVGLIRSYGNGVFKDAFRNRVMFPIEDLDGNIVGFSGRKYLPNDNESKYLNTTDTIIFKKGQILWNYHEARAEIAKTKTVYLFEGFMDVIAAYRAGVKNAVASMGTALTVDQINALSKVADTIIVCYDGDTPGVEATKRAISMIMQAGVSVKAVSLPDEIDPDEYINANGADALANYLLNNTISGLDFYYKDAKKHLDIDDDNSIETFKNQMFAYINMFHSKVLAERYLNIVANDLGVRFESLYDDFSHAINLTIDPSTITPEDYGYADLPINPGLEVVNQPKEIPNKYLEAERELLLIAYKHIDKVSEIVVKLEYNCVDVKNQNLLNHLEQIYFANRSIVEEEIDKKLDPEELELIKYLLESREIMPTTSEINILTEQVKKCSYERYVSSIAQKDDITHDDIDEIIKTKKKTTVVKKTDKRMLGDN